MEGKVGAARRWKKYGAARPRLDERISAALYSFFATDEAKRDLRPVRLPTGAPAEGHKNIQDIFGLPRWPWKRSLEKTWIASGHSRRPPSDQATGL
jgi:hypothetical protein